MVQTDQQFPSVSSQHKDLVVNADGSVDIYFGPKAPAQKANWIQTVPGKGWNTILRLYSPTGSRGSTRPGGRVRSNGFSKEGRRSRRCRMHAT